MPDAPDDLQGVSPWRASSGNDSAQFSITGTEGYAATSYVQC
jgi:hypothetical protein